MNKQGSFITGVLSTASVGDLEALVADGKYKSKKQDGHQHPTIFYAVSTSEQAVVRGTTNPAPCCHLPNDTDLLTA